MITLNTAELEDGELNQTVNHWTRYFWNYTDAENIKSVPFASQRQKPRDIVALVSVTTSIIFTRSSLHVLDDENDSSGDNVDKDNKNSEDDKDKNSDDNSSDDEAGK